ncbi:MAG: fasciclin domain-containing protein [Phormidesmis sp.]
MVFNQVQSAFFSSAFFSKVAIASGILAASILAAPISTAALANTTVKTAAAPSSIAQSVETNADSENIIELANSTAGFSTLSAAIEAANLGSILTGDGPFTLFAPTDAAFSALPDSTLQALLMPENRDLLVKLLYNHVGYGDVTSDQLSVGAFETFDGTVDVAVLPTGITVDGADVVQADVKASNGVIHAVDRVLIPAGFVDQLQARMNGAATPFTTIAPAPSEPSSDSSRLNRTTTLHETVIDRSATPLPAAPTAPTSSTPSAPSATPTAPQPQPAATEPVRGLW